MRRGWLGLTVAAIVAAIAFRFALVEIQRDRSAQRDLRSLELGNQRLRNRLGELTARAEPPVPAPKRRRASFSGEGRYVMRSSEASASAAPAPRHFDSPVDFFAAHPKFEDLYLSLVRSQIVANYGPLFRRLGLSPEQESKFEDLMTSHAESLADLVAAARDQNLSEDDDAVKPLRDQADANLSGGLFALLGQAGFDALQRYQGSIFWRSNANQLAGALYAGGTPLTSEQADSLSQALSDSLGQPSLQHNLVVLEPNADFAGALARARSILSPAQFPLFESELESVQLTAEAAKYQLRIR